MSKNKVTAPKKPRASQPMSKEVRWAAVVDYFFINGFNKREAMISAGYSEKSTKTGAHMIFRQPWVKAEIERRLKALAQKAELTEAWVIERLMRIADAGNILAPYKKVQEDGSLMWDFKDASPDALALLNEITVDYYTDNSNDESREVKKFRVSITEPKAALDSLARKLSLFKDSVDVNHGVADRLTAGRDRIRKLNAPE